MVNKIGKMCDMFFTGAKEANCRSKIDEILPIIMDSANEVVTSQSLCFTLGFCLTPLYPLGNEKVIMLYFHQLLFSFVIILLKLFHSNSYNHRKLPTPKQ